MKVYSIVTALTFLQVYCCLIKSAASFLSITTPMRCICGSRTCKVTITLSAAEAAAATVTAVENPPDGENDMPFTTITTNVSIGFIGFGTIAHAIATGLLLNSNNNKKKKNNNSQWYSSSTSSTAVVNISQMAISRRSVERSTAFAETHHHPDDLVVSVHDDNQKIIDLCDIIFLTVLPNQTAAVLQTLHFDAAKHKLVSLVSTATLPELSQHAQLPLDRVYKMICLPAVRHGQGVCLLQLPPVLLSQPRDLPQQQQQQPQPSPPPDHPENDIIHALCCQRLGDVVVARTCDEMSALMVLSGMMGPLYGILKNNRDFVLQHHATLSKRDATLLVIRFYENMLQDSAAHLLASPNNNDNNNYDDDDDDDDDSGVDLTTTDNHDLLQELIAEQTTGGINEQALHNLQQLGVMEAYTQTQTALLARIRGESDGSLVPTIQYNNSKIK